MGFFLKTFLLVLVLFGSLTVSLARAVEPLPVVATFSILGDMAQTIGGERVNVTTLVGPNGDPHVFRPTPRHAQAMAKAKLVFANGLGFEGWMDRLADAVGFRGQMVIVSEGVETLAADEDHDHGSLKNKTSGHDTPDPHAWHDLANGKIYARNIATSLIEIDPAGRTFYEQRLSVYLSEIDAVEQGFWIVLAKLPPGPHRVVTSHDAFSYFAHAYGIEFLAPQGVSTEAEASARDLASLIRQIRAQNVAAVFLENIADPRLIEQIQRETGAHVGGTLYSGSLSEAGGPAATYLEMMRYNINTLMTALSRGQDQATSNMQSQ